MGIYIWLSVHPRFVLDIFIRISAVRMLSQEYSMSIYILHSTSSYTTKMQQVVQQKQTPDKYAGQTTLSISFRIENMIRNLGVVQIR